MANTHKRYERAKQRIPGGTQLLSKRPELFAPQQWPAYFSRADGYRVWDLDGNEYWDTSVMGVGTNLLGYADRDVNDAVTEVVKQGNTSTLNAPEEYELAEVLCELHPWAEMVRYARTGGEGMAIAVRIARAATGRDTVLFCGYHGWHDWYIAANLGDHDALDGHLIPGLPPAGVPRSLAGTAHPFHYNDTDAFNELMTTYGDEVGAIVMEPIRNEAPTNEFRTAIHTAARERGIPLIVDEITAGWRLCAGGAHLAYDIQPDIAVFAKGMSNGFPMAAVIGTGEVMDHAQESFISSTYWTERIGPAAALATIETIRRENVPKQLIATGQRVKRIWQEAADDAGLAIKISGIDPLPHFDFSHEKDKESATLFTQLMLERGLLADDALYASYAHDTGCLDAYKAAVKKVFHEIRRVQDADAFDTTLKGPVRQSGFQRLT